MYLKALKRISSTKWNKSFPLLHFFKSSYNLFYIKSLQSVQKHPCEPEICFISHQDKYGETIRVGINEQKHTAKKGIVFPLTNSKVIYPRKGKEPSRNHRYRVFLFSNDRQSSLASCPILEILLFSVFWLQTDSSEPVETQSFVMLWFQ